MGCADPEAPAGAFSWHGTYVGGSAIDDCDAVTTDEQGYVYLACHVTSTDLPGIPRRERGRDDPMDAYVAKLSPDLERVEYGVLLAGGKYDGAFAIEIDERGHAIVAGLTASVDFPVTTNAVQGRYGGGDADVFVAEIDPDGAPVHVTFLGGGGTDRAFALALSGDGELLVGGSSRSSNLPGLTGAPVPQGSGANAFVTRLSLAGEPAIRTTVLAGESYEKITGIAIDANGDAVICGFTESADFPTTVGGRATLEGSADGFVARLVAAELAVQYSTLLGGSGKDAIWGIGLFPDGRAAVAGTTDSPDIPVTAGAPQAALAGDEDAFVAVLGQSGSAVEFATYFGGSANDSAAYDGAIIATTDSGGIWFAGQTHSTDLPTAEPLQPAYGGGDGDGFLARMDIAGGLEFATYIGGEDRDVAEGLAVGSGDTVWVTGLTSSNRLPFPLLLQPDHGGGRFDSFLVGIRQLRGPGRSALRPRSSVVIAAGPRYAELGMLD
jgi:hypothetical protein